jgi:hypothetical protein
MRLSKDKQSVLAAIYPIAALLTVTPLINAIVGTWPLRFASVSWRFGLTGMLLDGLITPLLGLALLIGVAAVLDHRVVLRVVSGAAVLAGAALSLAVVVFLLDYIELRATVAGTNAGGMDAAALKASLMAVVGVPSLIFLGRRGLSAAQLSPAEMALLQADPPLALHSSRTRSR